MAQRRRNPSCIEACLSPLAHALRQIAAGAELTHDEAVAAFGVVMAGEATASQIGALLLGLRARGETADEVAGVVAALRASMVPVPVTPGVVRVDTCGTGGGRVGTFNISTAAAFVVAGAGVPVAKHGNRSFTSRSGSADVLEALGVPVDLEAQAAAQAIERDGFAFLFAPRFHPAMRHVAPVRKELGVATVMNLVGPLANPAGVDRQVVGVADRERGALVARALARGGAVRAMVVHAEAGMDEISPVGRTDVWVVRDGAVYPDEVEAEALGVRGVRLEQLAGGSPAENAARVRGILDGADDAAGRAAVLLNAAAALVVAERAATMAEGMALAAESVDRGAALAVLRAVSTSG